MRPKQFAKLVGEVSSFQDAVGRAAALPSVQRIVVVASIDHEAILRDQLAAIGGDAHLILEPEGRDSGPAIAAAANWVHAQDPAGIAIFSAADHLLPDRAAYADAILAAAGAAADGLIVMLGVKPTDPSEAYGYLKPAGEGRVRRVECFVEKPSAPVARQYLEAGFLWNAGNFVIATSTLLEELAALCPDVQAAAVAGLTGAVTKPGATLLGPEFRRAPKIAFDHAVLEKTDKAAVVPVEFTWSDLGAWDAVWEASEKDAEGNVLSAGAQVLDATNLLVRADAGTKVAVIGLSDLAVIVENGVVLVCALSESQNVKAMAARMDEPS
jgi:mannose-1-phosphate guanylyltransferase/mannose-6-phosphate isomerase